MLAIITFMAGQSRGEVHLTMKSLKTGQKEEKGKEDLATINAGQSFQYGNRAPLSLANYTTYQEAIMEISTLVGSTATEEEETGTDLKDLINLKKHLRIPQSSCVGLDEADYKGSIVEKLLQIHGKASAKPTTVTEMTQTEYMAHKLAKTVS